ncbi:pre-toxin TG domain-containing protein [Streptomyces sp. NPDC015125]
MPGALDIPLGIGDVKGTAEANTATNSVTGERLSGSERLIGSESACAG